MNIRIGEGWDVHALASDRKLILGGVHIPHSLGLLGHSDADVLLHAITDAVLGAAGLGDIGRHFPDTDAQFKGADSAELLAEAMRRVRAQGWELVNVDSTIVAQAPKLAPHMPSIRVSVAKALGVDEDQVNVKAKTAEKLGPVGEGKSMEARAIALLVQR
ncbi:2-C-methyl-D-erythritol 2,4-cyclodiphosphate synthase [Limnohabitans sp.]|uniref:2-C-methyl-D-erythritol 2,4-cyclodiphosphate synthase n=1 Tax=Limnohabitans sp. TaxID=1907725 RepID=UPI00311F6840